MSALESRKRSRGGDSAVDAKAPSAPAAKRATRHDSVHRADAGPHQGDRPRGRIAAGWINPTDRARGSDGRQTSTSALHSFTTTAKACAAAELAPFGRRGRRRFEALSKERDLERKRAMEAEVRRQSRAEVAGERAHGPRKRPVTNDALVRRKALRARRPRVIDVTRGSRSSAPARSKDRAGVTGSVKGGSSSLARLGRRGHARR